MNYQNRWEEHRIHNMFEDGMNYEKYNGDECSCSDCNDVLL